MPFAGENGWLVWKGFISGPKIYFRSKKLVQHMNELCELAASSCQTLMLKHLHFLLKPQGCWMFPDLSSFCGSCQLPPSINHLSSSPLHLAILLISWCSALLVFCANRPTLLMKWIEIMALVCRRTCVRACVHVCAVMGRGTDNVFFWKIQLFKNDLLLFLDERWNWNNWVWLKRNYSNSWVVTSPLHSDCRYIPDGADIHSKVTSYSRILSAKSQW